MGVQAASLHQYFLQNTHKLRFLAPVWHGVLQGQQYPAVFRVRNVRRPESIVFYMAVFQQLCQNTLPIGLHQIFRGILGRKLKPLKYSHMQHGIGKKLLFDFLFCRPDIFFDDQPGTV